MSIIVTFIITIIVINLFQIANGTKWRGTVTINTNTKEKNKKKSQQIDKGPKFKQITGKSNS